MELSYYKKFEPIFGSWYITKLLGEGSYGKVFEIEKEDFGVTYKSALKVISIPRDSAELKAVLMEETEEGASTYFNSMASQFANEFALMASLKGNSNIVSYEDHHAYQHENGLGWDIFIRMELLTSMTDYIYQIGGSMTEAQVVRLGIDICNALELCQRKKIIHRDIKPENIFISENGAYKLGDFGIARIASQANRASTRIGTENYMAPEVYKGENYDFTVDTYSLGLVLYRLLNNNRLPLLPQPPAVISGNDRMNALAERINGAEIPAPMNASAALGNIILRSIQYHPSDRYHDPAEMREALEWYHSDAKQNARTNSIEHDVTVRTGGKANVEVWTDESPVSKNSGVDDKDIHTQDGRAARRSFGLPTIIVIAAVLIALVCFVGRIWKERLGNQSAAFETNFDYETGGGEDVPELNSNNSGMAEAIGEDKDSQIIDSEELPDVVSEVDEVHEPVVDKYDYSIDGLLRSGFWAALDDQRVTAIQESRFDYDLENNYIDMEIKEGEYQHTIRLYVDDDWKRLLDYGDDYYEYHYEWGQYGLIQEYYQDEDLVARRRYFYDEGKLSSMVDEIEGYGEYSGDYYVLTPIDYIYAEDDQFVVRCSEKNDTNAQRYYVFNDDGRVDYSITRTDGYYLSRQLFSYGDDGRIQTITSEYPVVVAALDVTIYDGPSLEAVPAGNVLKGETVEIRDTYVSDGMLWFEIADSQDANKQLWVDAAAFQVDNIDFYYPAGRGASDYGKPLTGKYQYGTIIYPIEVCPEHPTEISDFEIRLLGSSGNVLLEDETDVLPYIIDVHNIDQKTGVLNVSYLLDGERYEHSRCVVFLDE